MAAQNAECKENGILYTESAARQPAFLRYGSGFLCPLYKTRYDYTLEREENLRNFKKKSEYLFRIDSRERKNYNKTE